MESDLSKYKPLLDAVTAHVKECSGYEMITFEGGQVHTYFKYPGGEVPLPIEPSKPIPYLVEMVTKAIFVWKSIKAFEVKAVKVDGEANPSPAAHLSHG